MLEQEVTVLRFMQGYGDMLLSDIDPGDFCKQPKPGMNHPAWIIGHLAMAADGHSRYAGAEPDLTGWQERFGFGSELSVDPADYPSKDELIAAWHAANERLIDAVTNSDPSLLDKPTQGPLAENLPKVRDFLAFSMTGHTSLHLGQLSAWRRASGMPALF